MYAILTKFLGPTNTYGARIKATHRKYDGKRMSVIVGVDHALSERDNHAAAAMKLCRMVSDGGNNWVCGETDTGYAFVMQGEEFSREFGKQKGAA